MLTVKTGRKHRRKQLVSLTLAAVLVLVSIPSVSACGMAEAAQGQTSRVSDSAGPSCHDPVADVPPQHDTECQDCPGHCPIQTQAAPLPSPSLKAASLFKLPSGTVDPFSLEGPPAQFFKPPIQSPTPFDRTIA